MSIGDTKTRHEDLGLSEDELLGLYRRMLLTRRTDERSWTLNRQGKAAFVISGQGQEAAQVGAAVHIRPGFDYVYPYYRDLGIVLTVGMTPRDQFLSILGKAEDPSGGGRQMPGHFSMRELNIVTGSAPIGVQFPQAVGTALAFKMRGEDGVVLVGGGEASTSGGDWHEAMNMAGIHDLPVVFLIQNNQYAISVPAEKQVAGGIARRADGYGIPGVEVDGNDVLAVYGAAKDAFERARRGEGATLIEAKTYRMKPHSSDDDDRRYRKAGELEEWELKDPILRFDSYLEDNGLLDVRGRAEMDEEIKTSVREASAQAEAAADPEPESVSYGVYAGREANRDANRGANRDAESR